MSSRDMTLSVMNLYNLPSHLSRYLRRQGWSLPHPPTPLKLPHIKLRHRKPTQTNPRSSISDILYHQFLCLPIVQARDPHERPINGVFVAFRGDAFRVRHNVVIRITLDEPHNSDEDAGEYAELIALSTISAEDKRDESLTPVSGHDGYEGIVGPGQRKRGGVAERGS